MDNDPESIKSSRSLPQWMRGGRADNRFDTAEVPFSPPAHDESFFYIRYPTSGGGNSSANKSVADQLRSESSTVATSGTATKSLSELKAVVQSSTVVSKADKTVGHISAAVKEMIIDQAAAGGNNKVNIDLSKHTEPCRQYHLSDAVDKGSLFPGQKKSLGTDDGFKGARAACGSSIVRVAHQMVNLHRPFSRGFTVQQFDEVDYDSERVKVEAGVATAEEHPEQGRNMMRRGSKSLPASPMGSPKTVRKNPYFTGVFQQQQQQSNTEHRGWFLTSLLGVQQRDASISTTSSVNNIPEETDGEAAEYGHDSQMNAGSSSSTLGQQQPLDRKTSLSSVFRATKPSEIREMNFWTPTSM